MFLGSDVEVGVTEGSFPVLFEKVGVGDLIVGDGARSRVAVLDVFGNLVVLVSFESNSLTEGRITVVANLINLAYDSISHYYKNK